MSPRLDEGPRRPEFRNLRNLLRRMDTNEDTQYPISVAEDELPAWQRQLVWTDVEMGLLAYSILRNYPIGLIVLWRKPSGVRVPIDGRQRLTAIQRFFSGQVAIPDSPFVEAEFRNAKYTLLDEDDPARFRMLTAAEKDWVDDYEPQVIQFEDIAEHIAQDIFTRLQGGKSLTKTEVRAALPGRVCDFVTELTSDTSEVEEGEADEVEADSRHPFFAEINVRNTRKQHRNVCDILLHEFLFPGQDKHWSSLEAMYIEASQTLQQRRCEQFVQELNQFQRACTAEGPDGGDTVLLPQLRTPFLILTFFRAWRELKAFATPDDFSFADQIREFERLRSENAEDVPWVQFTAALSNAGYSQGRIDERHRIFMNFVLWRYPQMPLRDARRRTFSESQKIAVWERAGRRCEYVDDSGARCEEHFANFREADADHIVRWTDGGQTSLENARLLCTAHNRGG
jgi:hypothetical protein